MAFQCLPLVPSAVFKDVVERVGNRAQDAPHGGQRLVRDLQVRVRGAQDSLEHYCQCPVFWQWAWSFLAAPPRLGTAAPLTRIFLPSRERHEGFKISPACARASRRSSARKAAVACRRAPRRTRVP